MNNQEIIEIGGMSVRPVVMSEDAAHRQVLGEQPYRYELVTLDVGADLRLLGPARYCVYVLASSATVRINSFDVPVDSYVLGEADVLTIVASEWAQLLLVSQKIEHASEPLHYIRADEAKRVEKPWGHEIWLTGDPSPVFAFKRILLKAGNRTSLQYHRYKRETNFILAGQADLHYCKTEGVPAESVSTDMIAFVPITGPIVADIFPGLVHRLAARSDLTLFEVSTPELDDVVRIQDETGRAHGRIQQEHG